jgi:hypothetical protein
MMKEDSGCERFWTVPSQSQPLDHARGEGLTLDPFGSEKNMHLTMCKIQIATLVQIHRKQMKHRLKSAYYGALHSTISITLLEI